MSYTPPFTVTAKSINFIAEIAARLERLAIEEERAEDVRLRKINRMKTIRGSLAIEGNTLSEEQVTALIDGKHIVAPIKEVQEVRNAIRAYESFADFNPYDCKDLLKAHGMMALGLVDSPGHFRKRGVCVAGRDGVSHIAPPADRVPLLMADLFEWLKESGDHILIKSSVFHYEFEFIHPFEDGNGRMGRFWQSRLLAEWKPAFAYLPVENMVWENQAAYYEAIEKSTAATDSGIFVEFMLETILHSVRKRSQKDETVNDTENAQYETVNIKTDTVKARNETVNEQNDTVNPQYETVNAQDDTVNAENETVNGQNDTVNAESETVNAENETVNTESETVNEQNDTVNTESETVNEQDDTVNEENDTANAQDDIEGMILDAVRQNPIASYGELARMTGKSRATVSRKIAELKKSGILHRVGADKNGRWEVVE